MSVPGFARRSVLVLGAALVAGLGGAAGARAQTSDGLCLTADPPPVTRPAQALRFGITPGAAGSAGGIQGPVAPEDPAAVRRSLRALRPPDRTLVMRLNRMFWADGEAGVRRYGALVDRYAAAGFPSELQVRYHPPEGHAGDLEGWERYVRLAVRELGEHPAVTALSITNEANLPISGNTSDGGYPGAVEALVRGVVVAAREAAAIGRSDIDIGFTVMWRWLPDSDARFWQRIGELADPAFRRSLDYVGLQVYPGLVWPPAPLPGRTAGREIVEALTLLRGCYLPTAGLGRRVPLSVSENGYATNLGRSEPGQVSDLDSTVRDIHRWSGELGVTDYRYFNLRDNDSDGSDLFDAVGLLRDDYAPKPAFATLRTLIDRFGARDPRAGAPLPLRRATPRLTVRWRAAGRRPAVHGRLRPPKALPRADACRGTVTVRLRAGGRRTGQARARVRHDCRFTVRPASGHRRAGALHVHARFGGNRVLRPVTSAR